MCGQMGWNWLGKPNGANIPMLAVLSVLMDTRGGHSWGYYADGEIRKGVGNFVESVPARVLGSAQTFIGHTRLATKGSICAANSHPFDIGNTIGTHNGMIYNSDDLDKHYGRKFDVDSMHIFAHIDEQRSLSELRGYGSAVWLHKDSPRTVHFVRWNAGDLAIAEIYSKDKKLLGTAWASTPDALVPAIQTTGLTERLIRVDEERHYWSDAGEMFAEEKKSLHFGSGTRGYQNGSVHATGIGGEYVDNVWVEYVDDKLPPKKQLPAYTKPDRKPRKENFRDNQEIGEKLVAQGLKRIQFPGGFKILTPTQFRDWERDKVVQSRKCVSCELPNQATVRHATLGFPMCFDCTEVFDEYNEDPNVIEFPGINVMEDALSKTLRENNLISVLEQDERPLQRWLADGSLPPGTKLIIPDTIEFPVKDTVAANEIPM